MVRRFTGLAIVLLFACSNHADDLAALAKKEKERRAKLAKPSPVITETDTKTAAGGAVTIFTTPPTPAAPSSPPRTGPSVEEQKATWKARADAARNEIANAEGTLLQLERELAEYQADMGEISATEIQDPMRRQKREARIEELRQGLVQQRRILANAKTSLTVLEDTARANGVPPGWLR